MKLENHIKEAITTNNLVVFAGAGLSSNFGLPNWNQLVEEVITSIDKDDYNVFLPVLKIGAMKPSEVLQKLKPEHSIVKSYIKDNFNISTGEFKTHKNIIELTSCQIITTNYDNAFERASDDSINPSVYTDKYNISQINKGTVPYIFKLHGTYTEPSNCIIFEEDYLNLYKSGTSGAIEKLKSIFAEKVILFIGFSFNDPDINLIFDSLDEAFENNNKHFVLTKEPESFKKFNFLKPIQIFDYQEVDQYIDLCLEYKKNIEFIEPISHQIIEIEKREQRIAILSPKPVNLKIDSEINKVINNFDSIQATIFKGHLNFKTLLKLEDFDIIIIVSKVYKGNLYIEEDNLQSKLVSIDEICENIPDDAVPLVFITDESVLATIQRNSIFISTFKNATINKFIYKALKKGDFNFIEENIKVELNNFNLGLFENGTTIFKSIYGNDRDLDIGKKSLTNIIGRVEEQSTIVSKMINIIRSNKLLNVKASGGTGKTTLIKKCAYELYNRGYYKEGVNFKSCESVKGFDSFEELIVEGFNLYNIIDFKEHLIQNYSQKKIDLLIILDNFETVVNNLTSTELSKVHELLRFATDYASIVITSREKIGKSEDFEDVYSLSPLITDDALILFQENYGEINDKDEVRILRIDILEDLLNNNPLAIKLVTKSRTKFTHISQLKDQLKIYFFESTNEDFSIAFQDGADLNIERTKSIYQSINYSYSTLLEKEKVAFQLLSLFPDGISLSDFKKCFQKSTSTFKISDKEFRVLKDKSLVEDYNGTLQLQPIIRRFSLLHFSKQPLEKKQKFCLDAYRYNCFLLEIIELVEYKKSTSFSLKLASSFKNNLLNVLSYIPEIEINKNGPVPEKKYLLNFIYSVEVCFINKKQVSEFLERLNSVEEYFSDLPNAKVLIKVLGLNKNYYYFEFDNSYDELSKLLSVSEMEERVFKNEDYTEVRYKDIISNIHGMEGFTLKNIENHIRNENHVEYFFDAHFFYLGITENISRQKDGFYFYEYELMHNTCDVEKLKEYINSLYMDEHLEAMQCTYTLSKIEKLDMKIIRKLVVTNPYTKGLKELMFAFNETVVEVKKSHFEKALYNLAHIKYYYLEALYYYTLFLRDCKHEEFIKSREIGLKMSREFYYQYSYFLFENIDSEKKLSYEFDYDFYPTNKLKKYVSLHNEYWAAQFKKSE